MNLTLDEGSTAQEHLNLLAHLRGRQKSQYIKALCNRLLPYKTRVEQYTDSQRQCLQTLLALASDNSCILLLDEPTRGLGAQQRAEIINAIWRFKKDRYVVIQSTDTELVNMLADTVAKVLPTGVEVINTSQQDHSRAGDYRLVIQSERNNTKAHDNLVRYLWKDVPQLSLEYATEKLSYYILPNISKSLLQTKASFLEQNRALLGVVYFDFESLDSFETEKRKIAEDKPVQESPRFNGVQNQVAPAALDVTPPPGPTETQLIYTHPPEPQPDAAEEVKVEEEKNGHRSLQSDMIDDRGDLGSGLVPKASAGDHSKLILPPLLVPSQPEDSVEDGIAGDKEEGRAEEDQYEEAPTQGLIKVEANAITKEILSEGGDLRIDDQAIDFEGLDLEGQEMREFKELMDLPVIHPAPSAKGEIRFDFRRNRARGRLCILQCLLIFIRHLKEHWANKARFLALLIMPGLFTYSSWHFARYYEAKAVDSRVISPDWYPLKNKILVNEETIIGGKDTKRWVERLPMYEEAFEPTYVSTANHSDFYPFYDALLEYCQDEASERPWSYGSYELYEMDDEKHQYKFLSYVNATSPQAANTWP